MKSNKIIVALLVALLAVNSIGTVMTVIEEKEQTRIALKTAELTFIQAKSLTYFTVDESELLDTDFERLLKSDYEINQIGKSINEELLNSLNLLNITDAD